MADDADHADAPNDSSSSDNDDETCCNSDVDSIDGNEKAGDTPDGQWSFAAYSSRGAQMLGNLPKRTRASDGIKLVHNAADSLLLEKAKVEIAHSLTQIRRKVFRSSTGQEMTPVAAFAGAMPKAFLEIFVKWLKTGDLVHSNGGASSPRRTSPRRAATPPAKPTISFADLVEFLRCELLMRVLTISATELPRCKVPEDTIAAFMKVRKAMTKADRPASERPPVTEGVPSPEAMTFDPIMDEVILAMNTEWRDIYFVMGITYADFDDDKHAKGSPLWKSYGLRMTPTKDKKLKPVVHVMASIGSGNILWMCPDKNGLKMSAMLRAAIAHMFPQGQELNRHLFALFIDRGYMEFAKLQNMNVTNLVQILRELKVKFLSTMKNTAHFPFQVIERNEDGKTVQRKRLIVQQYGMRTNFIATQTQSNSHVQASVMRHGKGKARVARLATSIPACMSGSWVYETSKSTNSRQPHQLAPKNLHNEATRREQMSTRGQLFVRVFTS